MYIKIHRSYRNVVALCDAELLGRKLDEGIHQLDVIESFYKDKNVTQEEAIRILQQQAQEDATFNIIGKKSIAAAIAANLLTKKDVAHLAGIPFALVF